MGKTTAFEKLIGIQSKYRFLFDKPSVNTPSVNTSKEKKLTIIKKIDERVQNLRKKLANY